VLKLGRGGAEEELKASYTSSLRPNVRRGGALKLGGGAEEELKASYTSSLRPNVRKGGALKLGGGERRRSLRPHTLVA
jgi:hypothetical protein